MKIDVLCSDAGHPVYAHLMRWAAQAGKEHTVSLLQRKEQLTGGDMLFLVSCTEIIPASTRSLYAQCLVLHASDLPKGRGWCPHIWQILAGAREITLTLLEAEDEVDSGRILLQKRLSIPPDALWDEINTILFQAEIVLMDEAVAHREDIVPKAQDSTQPPTYYPRRSPQDSRIDPDKSLASQFDLIRVCDPQRFPAFFDLHGKRYTLALEKCDDEDH